MTNLEIKVWFQMFFEDGSVSEGKRLPAEILEDQEKVELVARDLLKGMNRLEGYLLIWGAGNLVFIHCDFSASSLKVSEISALESSLSLNPEHMNPE